MILPKRRFESDHRIYLRSKRIASLSGAVVSAGGLDHGAPQRLYKRRSLGIRLRDLYHRPIVQIGFSAPVWLAKLAFSLRVSPARVAVAGGTGTGMTAFLFRLNSFAHPNKPGSPTKNTIRAASLTVVRPLSRRPHAALQNFLLLPIPPSLRPFTIHTQLSAFGHMALLRNTSKPANRPYFSSKL